MALRDVLPGAPFGGSIRGTSTQSKPTCYVGKPDAIRVQRPNRPHKVRREDGERASLRVDGTCHWLQVVRVHTGTDTAEMIQFEVIRNRAASLHPKADVRPPTLAIAETDDAVPVAHVDGPLPDPARRNVPTILFNVEQRRQS